MRRKPAPLALPWVPLARPLSATSRAAVAQVMDGLLAWQIDLRVFPHVTGTPEATPFVALYADGRLRGSFGSIEGSRSERLARAFLYALFDPRYGGVQPDERARAVARVSYLCSARRVSTAELRRDFELGTDGIAVMLDDRATLLLPSVAVDERVDVRGMLALAARKIDLPESHLSRATLATFHTEEITVRLGSRGGTKRRKVRPLDAAAEWLSDRVGRSGRVGFGVDARQRVELEQGPFLHGRAAVVIQALAAHGGHPRIVERARRWLAAEVRAALDGRHPPGWPEDPAASAGAIALASRAGIDVERQLATAANHPRLLQNPWHGAQVVASLGRRAPERLWSACIADLSKQPWAPWTAIAAHEVGDEHIWRRAERDLCQSIRRRAPYAGSVHVSATGEVALTALTAEALTLSSSPSAAAAIATYQLPGARFSSSCKGRNMAGMSSGMGSTSLGMA